MVSPAAIAFMERNNREVRHLDLTPNIFQGEPLLRVCLLVPWESVSVPYMSVPILFVCSPLGCLPACFLYVYT